MKKYVMPVAEEMKFLLSDIILASVEIEETTTAPAGPVIPPSGGGVVIPGGPSGT